MVTCSQVANFTARNRSLMARSGCLFVSICLAYESLHSNEEVISRRIAKVWDETNEYLTKNKHGQPILMNGLVADKIAQYYNTQPTGHIIGFSYGKQSNSTHFVLVRNGMVYDTGIKSSLPCLTVDQWKCLNNIIRKNVKLYTIRTAPYSL